MSEGISAVEAEVRFNAIVEEYGKYLRSVIGKVCPTDMGIQSSDIEQEARIRLWRALQSGKEIVDPASYIYRIVATTTIDAIRRVKARREEQLRVVEEEGEEEGPVLMAAADHSPERRAQRQQLIGKVRGAFDRIAEDRRQAALLHLEGMTPQEIACATGWTEPRARHLAYRGLKDLRQQLKAEGVECEID